MNALDIATATPEELQKQTQATTVKLAKLSEQNNKLFAKYVSALKRERTATSDSARAKHKEATDALRQQLRDSHSQIRSTQAVLNVLQRALTMPIL